MHEGNEDAQSRAEHGHTRTKVLSRLSEYSRAGEGRVPRLLEFEYLNEEDDVFAAEFDYCGVGLEALIGVCEAFVERLHCMHLARPL